MSARETRAADRETDALYGSIRSSHGGNDARANGYRANGWFLAEQRLVMAVARNTEGVVVDVGAGSGLMGLPLHEAGRTVMALDFNQTACMDARANGLGVVRGNAFSLPVADGSVGCIINCQFLNQQSDASAATMMEAFARALAPAGRAIIVWRNGTALIHRAAHGVFSALDALAGRTPFPYVNHRVATLTGYARSEGLVVERAEVVFPPAGLAFADERSLAGRLLGASGLLVLRRD